MHTYDLLAELKLDVAHLAMYSPRPHTASARRMADDVSHDEKLRRLKALDALQENISRDINARRVGAVEPVLVESRHKHKWRGRTPTNKLVFFENDDDWTGRLVSVRMTSSGAWSMRGELTTALPSGAPRPEREFIPLLSN